MKIHVVHGAPLSGKTTYVQENMGMNDLVYDYDLIMSAISGRAVHNHNVNLMGIVVDLRDLMITKIDKLIGIENLWIITTEVKWDLKKMLEDYEVIYKHIRISKDKAESRLSSEAGNRDTIKWQRLIDNYFIDEIEEKKTFEQEQRRFYNSMTWLHLRDLYMQEKDYECERCHKMCYRMSDKGYIRGKKLGQDVRYGIVHHKQYLDEETIKDAKVALNQENLELLCTTCHNQEHHSHKKNNKQPVEIRKDVRFDEEGNLIL